MSRRIYRLLLRLYPNAFLREYREPMAQAFRDQWRATPSRVTLIAATLADLARSILRSYQEERADSMKSLKLHTLALFAVMIVFLGRFELHTDDAGVVLFFTITFAFVLGYLNPAWAKLWALVGLCVPLAHIVVRPGQVRIEPHTPPPSWGSLAAILLIVLVLGAAGSYIGTKVRGALHPPTVA